MSCSLCGITHKGDSCSSCSKSKNTFKEPFAETVKFELRAVNNQGTPWFDGFGRVFYTWRTSSGTRTGSYPLDFDNGVDVFPFTISSTQSIPELYFEVQTAGGTIRSPSVSTTGGGSDRTIRVNAVVPSGSTTTAGAAPDPAGNLSTFTPTDISTTLPDTINSESLVSYVPQAAFDVAVGQIWDTINPMKTQVNKIDQIIMPQILAQQKSIDVFNNELGILRTRSEVDRVSISDINKRLNDPVFGINAINAGLKQASIDMQTVNARTEANAANIADLAEALNTDLENRPPPSSGGNWWDGILAGFGGAGVGAIVALIVIALVVMRK